METSEIVTTDRWERPGGQTRTPSWLLHLFFYRREGTERGGFS